MAHWSQYLSPVSVVITNWETLTPPGRDTNPSQVSSQQMLVFAYLLWKWKSHKNWNFCRAAEPEPKPRPCDKKTDILPTAPTMPHIDIIHKRRNFNIFFVYIQIRPISLVLDLKFQTIMLTKTKLVGQIWMCTDKRKF